MELGSTPELHTFDAYESEVKEVIGSCATIPALADELVKKHFITRQRKVDILRHPSLLQHEKLQQLLDAVRSQVKHNPGNFDVFIGILEEQHPLCSLADKMKQGHAKLQVLFATISQLRSHGSSDSASTTASTEPSPRELQQAVCAGYTNIRNEDTRNNEVEDSGSSISLSSLISRGSLASHGSMASTYSALEDKGNYDITGQVECKLRYASKQLVIDVVKAEGLAAAKKGRYSDPYVKTYLLPDMTKKTKRKTSIRHKTTSPVYDESLKYEPVEESELRKCTLLLSVWDWERFGRNRFLGEVRIPLSTIDLTSQDSRWYELQDKDASVFYRGQLRLGLKFSPGKHTQKKVDTRTKGDLHIFIKQAVDLSNGTAQGPMDAVVKCYLLPNKRRPGKRKTAVVKGSMNPVWEEQLTYEEVTLEELTKERVLEVTVWDNDGCRHDFIGALHLGSALNPQRKRKKWMDSFQEEETHWEEMLSQPGQWAEKWHILRPTMKNIKSSSQLQELSSLFKASPVKSIPDPELPRLDQDTGSTEGLQRTSTAFMVSHPSRSLSNDAEEPERSHPSQPPSKVTDYLTNYTLFDVLSDLEPAKAQWYNLGLGLKVRTSDLDAIDRVCRNPIDALREMLDILLDQVCPQPTWQDVVRVLRSPVLEKQNSLASELEAKYCSGSCAITATATTAKGRGDQGMRSTEQPRHSTPVFTMSLSSQSLYNVTEEIEHADPSPLPRQAAVSISSPTFEPAADNSASQGEVIELDNKLKEYLRMLPPSESFMVVLVGDSYVGKSSLFQTFRHGELNALTTTTIGVEFYNVKTKVFGKEVRMEIWDTAGTERYHSMMVQQHRNAHGVIFVFDVTNRKSLENITLTWKKVLDSCHPHAVKLLVGNKCDLERPREVDTRTAKHYAEENGMVFLEASAKNNYNVQEIFQTVASEICRVQAKGQGILQHGRQGVDLTQDNNNMSIRQRCSTCTHRMTTWYMHMYRRNQEGSEVTS